MKKLNLCFLFFIPIIFSTPSSDEYCQVANQQTKEKLADLSVIEINEPIWQDSGTYFQIKIQNIGDAASLPCKIKLSDVDMSVEEGKKLKLDNLFIQMLEENNSRARYEQIEMGDSLKPPVFDYDEDFELLKEIPALNPKEQVNVSFFLPVIWVYNSNCELKVEIDIENKNIELKKDNNIKYFFAWG